MQSCSLDDIDLSALKVSEIMQNSVSAKVRFLNQRRKLRTIDVDTKSLHEFRLLKQQ